MHYRAPQEIIPACGQQIFQLYPPSVKLSYVTDDTAKYK